MSSVQRHLWLAATLLAAALILTVLCGCGGSKPEADPIVGTWRAPSARGAAPEALAIAKVDGRYLGTVADDFDHQVSFPLLRAGDELRGTLERGEGSLPIPVELHYLPASGHLTWSQWDRKNDLSAVLYDTKTKPVEMTKVSDGTTLPAPSP